MIPKAEWRIAVEECIERIGVSAPFFVRNVMRALVPDDEPIDGQVWPSEEWRAVMRGLVHYADGHELRGKWCAELKELKQRAAKLLAAAPPAQGSASSVEGLAGALLKARGSGWDDNTQVVQTAMEEAKEILALEHPAQGSAGWSMNDPKLIEAALALAVDFFNTHHDWPEITKRMPEALARFRALAPPVEAQGSAAEIARLTAERDDWKQTAEAVAKFAEVKEAAAAQGSAGWKLLRDEFREAVTAKDDSALSDAICRIMGNCDCSGDHGADPETSICWKAAKAILAPPVEVQGSERLLREHWAKWPGTFDGHALGEWVSEMNRLAALGDADARYLTPAERKQMERETAELDAALDEALRERK